MKKQILQFQHITLTRLIKGQKCHLDVAPTPFYGTRHELTEHAKSATSPKPQICLLLAPQPACMQLCSPLEAEQGVRGEEAGDMRTDGSVVFLWRPVGGTGTVRCGEEMDA